MDLGPRLIFAMIEGLVASSVLALIAVGLSLVFGVMRVVNVAHGEFFMIGAVLTWVCVTAIGGDPALGFVVALVVAPILAGVLAAAADVLVLKRLNYNPEATIVATIGLLYIIQQSTLMSFGPDPRSIEAPFNERLALPWFEFGENGLEWYYPWGFGTTTYKLFVIAAGVVLLTGVWLAMTRTRLGMVLRACQLDPEMARAFGIDVDKVYALVFGVGAGLAALAAVLIMPIQQAHYLMGGEPLLLSFIVVIIGGLGSIPGTMLAALLIGMSDAIITVGLNYSPTFSKILATLAVAFVLIFRPQGLFGKRTL